MKTSLRGSISGWLLIVVGIFLCALPLYAELFTKKLLVSQPVADTSEGHNSMHNLYAFASGPTESYSMMHVSLWLPVIGGLIALVGGFLIGRSRVILVTSKSIGDANHSKKNAAEQVAASDC